jgi:hypothetical protein
MIKLVNPASAFRCRTRDPVLQGACAKAEGRHALKAEHFFGGILRAYSLTARKDDKFHSR